MTVYIIMGVSGCGKSTVGSKAAEQLDIPFLEGDDFHPATNITKMSGGIALTDKDRMPWVDAMVKSCNLAVPHSQKTKQSVILACSALSETVRERLRKGHFFTVDLLASQFAALDIPRGAVTLDIAQSLDELVTQLCDIIESEDEA